MNPAISTYRKKATRFTALSEFAKSKFIESEQVNPDPLMVKLNFVDIDFKSGSEDRIRYENFPRTLVEAFACGLPVIASRLGALPEIVQEGHNGLLFDPGSAKDLASKMAWADIHPSEMAEMLRNARAAFESKYTAQQNYRQLMQIYDEAIAGARRTPILTTAPQQI